MCLGKVEPMALDTKGYVMSEAAKPNKKSLSLDDIRAALLDHAENVRNEALTAENVRKAFLVQSKHKLKSAAGMIAEVAVMLAQDAAGVRTK